MVVHGAVSVIQVRVSPKPVRMRLSLSVEAQAAIGKTDVLLLFLITLLAWVLAVVAGMGIVWLVAFLAGWVK